MMFGQRLAAAIFSVWTLTCHAGVPTKMSESTTQTYCVGRFVVDVPDDAKVHGEVNEYVFGPVEAQRVHMDEPAFRDLVKHREADLPKTLGSRDYKLVKSVSAGPRAQIITGSMDLYGNATYGFDATKLDDSGVLFNLHADPYEPKAFESVVPDVKKILDALRGRTENTIPHAPGFCIRDGFIADDGKGGQYEDASISFQFAQWPGVLVTVRTMTVIKPGEPTLLQRIDKDPVPDVLKNIVSQVRTLRKGKHDVNGRHGEELVASLPTHSSYRLYKFRWESQGDLKAPLKPTVIVELESGSKSENGEPVNPKLAEGDALALFDAVLNSVRLRPTSGNATVSEAAPHPDMPLGTLARTGSVCPQTGWWACPEAGGHTIAGGERQFFEKGAVLPVVRVKTKAGILAQFFRKAQWHSTETTWRLVGYQKDEPPAFAGAHIPGDVS